MKSKQNQWSSTKQRENLGIPDIVEKRVAETEDKRQSKESLVYVERERVL